jgi:hypothetical protein
MRALLRIEIGRLKIRNRRLKPILFYVSLRSA